MKDQAEDARVDELRRQLRSLGYLDAGVDRFVLGPARSQRGPVAIGALASVRVGLLAAALLGPAAAAGIGTRLPGLVTGVRDAIVVALYLAAIFGVAAVAFTFVISAVLARLLAGSAVARARLYSRSAGTLVAAACLAYLTMWWRSANAGLAWDSPAWTAFALAVAVVISMVIGHAVSITTFAVTAARQPAPVIQPARPSSSRKLLIAAGTLAFCGSAMLLLLTAPVGGRPTSAPPLAVVSPGVRVRVVAIDGFDPDVYQSLQSAGQLPVLSQLLSNGAARFVADDSRDPARAWTTVATGLPPDAHGVHALETRRVAGIQGTVASGEAGLARAIRMATDLLRLTRPSVASGAELRAKPVWEVAADAGLRTAVVNWWATWPAIASQANAPAVISDRASLRLERGGALDAEIAPPDLYDRLKVEWPAIKTAAQSAVSQALRGSGDTSVDAVLRRSAELDAQQIALLSRVSSDRSDLLVLYLQGLDVAQHSLLEPVAGASPSAIESRLDALRAYYVFLDTLLQPLAASRETELIVLVTQPGRLTSRTEGLMALDGPGVARGSGLGIRPVDVAPTVLHALGLPISRELAGAPALAMFSPAFTTRFPVREVSTYGQRHASAARRGGDPLDAEAIERLRSLGYVR